MRGGRNHAGESMGLLQAVDELDGCVDLHLEVRGEIRNAAIWCGQLHHRRAMRITEAAIYNLSIHPGERDAIVAHGERTDVGYLNPNQTPVVVMILRK